MEEAGESDAYPSFCDVLWRSWLNDTLEVPPSVRAEFDLHATPEPYLTFRVGAHPLVVLTMNRGKRMPLQLRATILSGEGPVSATNRYEAAAHALSTYYIEQLGGPARRRIGALAQVAEWAGYDGYLQVECFPFHSPRLTIGRISQVSRRCG